MKSPKVSSATVCVLLVYEEVPEDTKVYRLQVTQDEFERMSRCHGRFTNHDSADGVEDDLSWLDDYLSKHGKEDMEPGKPLEITADGVHFILTGILL